MDTISQNNLHIVMKQASMLRLKMNMVFDIDSLYFGSFMKHLLVSEIDFIELCHNILRSKKIIKTIDNSKYTLVRSNSTRLNSGNSYKDNLEILRQDYYFDTIEEIEKYFVEKEGIDLKILFYGNAQSNSLTLAQNARDYWFSNKLNIDKFELFIENGFDKELLIIFLENIRDIFRRFNVTQQIATKIENYVEAKNQMYDTMIANMIAGYINEFINSLGWSFYTQAQKEEISKIIQENKLNIPIPEDMEVFEPSDKLSTIDSQKGSVQKLIDYVENLNDNLSKKPIDTETLKYVPMIRNYQRWINFMQISFITLWDIPRYNPSAANTI